MTFSRSLSVVKSRSQPSASVPDRTSRACRSRHPTPPGTTHAGEPGRARRPWRQGRIQTGTARRTGLATPPGCPGAGHARGDAVGPAMGDQFQQAGVDLVQESGAVMGQAAHVAAFATFDALAQGSGETRKVAGQPDLLLVDEDKGRFRRDLGEFPGIGQGLQAVRLVGAQPGQQAVVCGVADDQEHGRQGVEGDVDGRDARGQVRENRPGRGQKQRQAQVVLQEKRGRKRQSPTTLKSTCPMTRRFRSPLNRMA